MDDTPNLGLPYLLAAQAQKHVTHNEAIRALDAIVQLSVLDRDLTTPPGSPGNGDRYIVGGGATGEWAGHEGEIAAFQDNAWLFYVPLEGWLCWVADEDSLLAWDGLAWGTLSGAQVNPAPLVGINTTADATNRLAVSSPNTLFTHEGSDHRVKVNKAAAANTASFLFQSNWSGRAEIGLVGDDDFRFKVSPDGSSWFDAIKINKTTGEASFPNSFVGGLKNLLVNGDFQINQRSFAGGALAAGEYGFDRWKADTGGADLSVSGSVVTLTSGTVEQVIETPDLGGETVTISVEDLGGGNLTIDIAGQSATISAGTGRKSATISIPAGSTGNVSVKLTPAGAAVTFSRVQLEKGAAASSWEQRPVSLEQILAERYFVRSSPGNFGAWGFLCKAVTSALAIGFYVFRVPMRISPSMVVSSAGDWSVQSTGGGDSACSNIVSFSPSPEICEVRFTRSSGGMIAGNVHSVRALSNTATMEFDAEI